VVSAGVAASGGPVGASAQVSAGGGQNQFWKVTNQYAEKITAISAQLTATSQSFYQNINPGQFLRGVRFLVRSIGASGGTVTADNPPNTFFSLDLQNVDGSEILYPMSGFAHQTRNIHFRPWLGDPRLAYDYARSINPSFTLFLQPEIRHTAGVLSNTDARSQYRYNLVLNTAAQVVSGGTTAPTVSVTSYMDAWAQPDATDLQGNPNQPLPPGLNLQTVSRHETLTLLGAGAQNVFQIHETGNELRGWVAIVRDSNNARQDYLSDPIRLTIDNRNLGVLSPDELFQWANNMLAVYEGGAYTRDTGVYPYLRWFDPGQLKGQGWMATNNATKLIVETSTLSTATNVPGSIEFITDEVIPVGPIPADLDMI